MITYLVIVTDENTATIACQNFGDDWSVSKVTRRSLVCTINGRGWTNNCDTCSQWRLVVWEDGGFEYDSYGKFSSMSTVAGKYYAAHDPCDMDDNYPLCGSWI